MNRRQFLSGSATALLSVTGRAASNKPNVLFIIPDQLRGMDLGCAGNAQLSTPHLDALAREGFGSPEQFQIRLSAHPRAGLC